MYMTVIDAIRDNPGLLFALAGFGLIVLWLALIGLAGTRTVRKVRNPPKIVAPLRPTPLPDPKPILMSDLPHIVNVRWPINY